MNNSSSKEVAYLRSRMTLVHHLRRKLVPRSLSQSVRNLNHQGKRTNRVGSGRLQISQELRSFAEYGILECLRQNFRCQRIQLQIWFRWEECFTCKLFRTHVKPSSFFWQDAWGQFAPFALPQILPWARQSLTFVRTILCSTRSISGCVSWTWINLWPIRNHDTLHITSRNRGGGKLGSGSKDGGHEKKQSRPQRIHQKPSLENLTIATGSFLLASGEHATIGGTFCISGHGVFTTPPCDYATILKGKSPLVPQELGLLVLSKPTETNVPCREVEFAACDQSGNGLLLQGWLLQFGKKHVEPGKVKDLQIPLEDTKTLAITAFRDEWQEKAIWNELVKGPAKLVIETFALDTAGIYEVWGRSWRKNNKPTQPDLAFSFRLWIKVKSALAKEPLAKSGLTFPPFYVEDKQSNDKSPMQNKFDFRILWIPRDMPPSDAISKIQQHHGC